MTGITIIVIISFYYKICLTRRLIESELPKVIDI